MLYLSKQVSIPASEIELHAVRSQGAGGQNVNKVATAIHLRFDIKASSLPAVYKQRLLARGDQRINKDGIVVIKSQAFRTQAQNREAALQRLQTLLQSVMLTRKKRVATRVPQRVRRERLEQKRARGEAKTMRRKISRVNSDDY